MSILSHFSQLTQAPTQDRLPNFGENRIQGLSTVQAPTPSTSIMSLVTTALNFVIFILSSLSLIVGALSLVLARFKNLKMLTHLSQPTPLALKSSNSPMVDFRALSKR